MQICVNFDSVLINYVRIYNLKNYQKFHYLSFLPECSGMPNPDNELDFHLRGNDKSFLNFNLFPFTFFEKYDSYNGN
jgi:hypothetical protein